MYCEVLGLFIFFPLITKFKLCFSFSERNQFTSVKARGAKKKRCFSPEVNVQRSNEEAELRAE